MLFSQKPMAVKEVKITETKEKNLFTALDAKRQQAIGILMGSCRVCIVLLILYRNFSTYTIAPIGPGISDCKGPVHPRQYSLQTRAHLLALSAGLEWCG